MGKKAPLPGQSVIARALFPVTAIVRTESKLRDKMIYMCIYMTGCNNFLSLDQWDILYTTILWPLWIALAHIFLFVASFVQSCFICNHISLLVFKKNLFLLNITYQYSWHFTRQTNTLCFRFFGAHVIRQISWLWNIRRWHDTT